MKAIPRRPAKIPEDVDLPAQNAEPRLLAPF